MAGMRLAPLNPFCLTKYYVLSIDPIANKTIVYFMSMRKKDYIFLEASDSCALCSIKGADNLTIHHIDKDEKNNEYDNLILLCHNCHCRHHQNKGISKKLIVETKRKLILKTLTHFGVNALKIAYRNKVGVAATRFLLSHLIDLGLLKFKEELSSEAYDGEIVSTEALFEITEKGKRYYKKWLNKS